MAIKQPFVRVDAEVRPGHDVKSDRAVRRSKNARSKMAAGGAGNHSEGAANRKFLIGTWLSLSFMLIYALTIGMSLLAPGYSRLDRIASGFLMFGLGFIIVHGFGYANSMIKANWAYKSRKPPMFAASGGPRVACLISSYNEPHDVLEETVAAVMALDYQGKEVFILDDSTTVEARQSAQKIAARYGIRCVQRTNRRGYKAGAINDFLPSISAPYIALFDADALPTAQFLRECVPQIDENPKLGFLQTPQFYANTQVSYAALASARQQNVFYEYICEGKSVSRAAFCCGTNVLFRRSALVDVGGFNEQSVTEDFATSFHMHVKGYDSLYLNRTYVYSLAPENLAAYFTQQSRWSFGTMGTARQFIQQFFKNPRVLSAGQWWEYFLSATYYLIGWVNFVFILLPMMYLFFDVRPLRQDVFTYLLVFVPYMLFTLNMFYSGMERRGYGLGETILGQQIGFLSFPIHMKSAFSALMGHKRPFGVTPKGVGGRISWWALWPQLLLMLLSLGAFLMGAYRIVAGRESDVTALALNSLWALYHVWMLSGIFRLNQPVREGAEKQFFGDARSGKSAQPLPTLEGLKNPLTLRRVGALVSLVTLCVLGFAGFEVAKWSAAPAIPVNVYLVDRTLGPNARQHRGVTWTLNFLKVRKQPGFNASGDLTANSAKNARTNYDVDADYFGLVPDPKAIAKPDATGQGDGVKYGFDRALPPRLSEPGAIYLADTYGEYEEFDARIGKYVRTRDVRRGLSSPEIDAIEAFARRGGLVMAEWNTLGYPTRPSGFVSPAQLEIAIDRQRQRVARLERKTIPQARETLRRVQSGGTFKAIGIARGKLEDARGALIDATYKQRSLQGLTISSAVAARQDAAATRLERLLRVSYAGWYGRYVDNFAREREYDFRLWKNVRDALNKQNDGRITEPSGAGFVFYPDGPSRIFDPNSGTFQASPFSQPVILSGRELGTNAGEDAAVIERSRDPKITDDPLLRGVRTPVPGRNWFDVVVPQSGARVLANYRLSITPAAAARLRKAGFPARCIARDGRSLLLPAAVAGRDGNVSGGRLRSLYLSGDASSNFSVSPLAQKYPALGGIEGALSPRFGDFPARTYWGFYEPLMRNVFTDTPQIRVKR